MEFPKDKLERAFVIVIPLMILGAIAIAVFWREPLKAMERWKSGAASDERVEALEQRVKRLEDKVK